MTRFLWPILSMAVLFAASPAHSDVAKACADDVKSYCKDVKPENFKLKDCMAENRAKLSNTCKIAVGDRQLELDAEQAVKRKSSPGMAPKAK